MRVRRRAELVCRWRSGGIRIGIPGGAQWATIQSDLAAVLFGLDEFTDIDDITKMSGTDDEELLRRHIETLLHLGILVTDSDSADAPNWGHEWGSIATRFHAESRDAEYLVDSPERDSVAAEIAADGDPPAIFKDYPGHPLVKLPDPLPLHMPTGDVFAARRTHREFTADTVSMDQLATVLGLSFGTQRYLDGGMFGLQQGRVSASAGARHEVEAYVVVYAVQGVEPGLYHYSARHHALELLNAEATRAQVAELSYGQDASFSGAFTVLTTAIPARLEWKYRHPRAYRLWMYDAGHYGQTFALACTAAGLGPFQTVAFLDSAVEKFLGVDPAEEFAAYLLSAGIPAQADHPVRASHATILRAENS